MLCDCITFGNIFVAESIKSHMYHPIGIRKCVSDSTYYYLLTVLAQYITNNQSDADFMLDLKSFCWC